MSTRFDERKHPRDRGGKFTAKTYTEAEDVDITDTGDTGCRVAEARRAVEAEGTEYMSFDQDTGEVVFAENMKELHVARMDYVHALVSDHASTGSVKNIEADTVFTPNQREAITRMTPHTDNAGSVFNPDMRRVRREADQAEQRLVEARGGFDKYEKAFCEQDFYTAQFDRAVFGDVDGAREALKRQGVRVNDREFEAPMYQSREALEMARLSGAGANMRELPPEAGRRSLLNMNQVRVTTLMHGRFEEEHVDVHSVTDEYVQFRDHATGHMTRVHEGERERFFVDDNRAIVMARRSGFPRYIITPVF